MYMTAVRTRLQFKVEFPIYDFQVVYHIKNITGFKICSFDYIDVMEISLYGEKKSPIEYLF